jgi:hypothetical protein
VSDQPERPYVPRPTPQGSRQVVIKSEFALARPFVPGIGEPLPSIANFLDTADGYVETGTSQTFEAEDSYSPDLPYELPPIEHFIDPLPAAGAFAAERELAHVDNFLLTDDSASNGGAQNEAGDAGWLEDELQQYDWRAAAALGDESESEASNEWATTDWEVAAPTARERKQSVAEAIANALDQIARRIREGELSVPSRGAGADPAAIAASLASLFGSGSSPT